ncbi:hypothetical protein Sango_2797800 [Sesamum angolense]|uniref:Reverse transcriptase domain-containing protein n=1 Tax=Sesamum angolense TaxID=2727404 RepID=A0AAE1VZX1_9LAMI|nr:hypothetical protein Sango_2797800 [Sesamum angolense]
MMTPWASNRPLAATACDASTAAPSEFKKLPRPLALLTTPMPLTATTMDAVDGLLSPRLNQAPLVPPSPPWAAPPCVEVWASSPLVFAAPTVNVHQPPSTDSMLGPNGSFHHQSPAASSPPTSLLQPVVARAPSPPWVRVASPQQHAAPAPLPVPSVRPQSPPTAFPTTTAAPAKPLLEFFIGNVPLHPHSAFKIDDDKIAAAFHNSSQKTLNFIPPSVQNGEVIVHPSIDMIQGLSTVSSGIGRPLYPDAITRACTRLDFAHVCVMLNVSSKLPKHVVIIKHLPTEYWTDEGLSGVASSIGQPLYTDAVTKQCSRFDYARVCVMLDYNSVLPKHLVIMSPFMRDGKEVACRVDIEYEWLPQRCKECKSLGHTATVCPELKRKILRKPVEIYVQKTKPTAKIDKGDKAVESSRNDSANENTIRVLSKQPVWNCPTIKAASWNVRGLNGVAHQRSVVQLVREFQLQFLHLVETRVRVQNAVTVQNSILQNWSWFTDYNGPGGRIWLAWLPSEVEVDILQVDNQYIHCKVTNKKEHTKCLKTMLYGEYDLIPRRSLWRCIQQLATDICDDPWLITGDFNAVIDDSEVSGTAADTSQSMTEFRECVTKLELLHLPFAGAPFTWHNCSEGGRSLWKRLDRMLLCSGHMETSHSRGCYVYSYKETQSFEACSSRASETSGDLAHNVHMAEKFLSAAQTLNQKYQHDNVLIRLEKCCRIVYCKVVALEVNMLQQRAKLSWIKGGDKCSKIFFRKINARRATERVFQIKNSEGIVLMDYLAVIDEFVNYFEKLFGGTRRNTQIDLTHLHPFVKNIITKSEAELLISPIQRQEIKDALFDIDEDSAPGPDGFSSGFFKSAWAVIMDDFCSVVHDFFYHSKMLKQLNTTLLALVPKVNMPIKVGDFRPIACCNVIYKVINKIMVKRMQLVLDKLIASTQNAFVPGRSIPTNVLLAQELLFGYNQKKLPPRCMIKVDLQMD